MENKIIEQKSTAKSLLQIAGSLLFIAGLLGYAGKLSMPPFFMYGCVGLGLLLTLISALKK